MQHGANKFERRPKDYLSRKQNSAFSRWVKSYVECLLEKRDVVVLSKHERELELFLW